MDVLRETKLRSILKTLSWRFLATLTTTLLVLMMTDTWAVALSVGGMEVLGKLLLYYLHERAWQRFSWGVMPAAVDAEALTQELSS